MDDCHRRSKENQSFPFEEIEQSLFMSRGELLGPFTSPVVSKYDRLFEALASAEISMTTISGSVRF